MSCFSADTEKVAEVRGWLSKEAFLGDMEDTLAALEYVRRKKK